MVKKRMMGVLVVMLLLSLVLVACSQATARPAPEKVAPSKLEPIEGSEVSRVILTEKAAERLGIETAQVREEEMEDGERLVIPYAAVLYTEDGQAWVYTNPEPFVFVRHPVTIERIDDEDVILKDGPAIGTTVVTAGAAELFGIEFGIGH